MKLSKTVTRVGAILVLSAMAITIVTAIAFSGLLLVQ